MKQISKKDWARLQADHSKLDEIRGKLEDYLDEVRAKLEELQQEVNDALQEVGGHVEDIANEAQGYYDERSEKWQEGDAGQQYAEWISELEQARANIGEEVSLNIDTGIDVSALTNALEALDGGFRQAPDE